MLANFLESLFYLAVRMFSRMMRRYFISSINSVPSSASAEDPEGEGTMGKRQLVSG